MLLFTLQQYCQQYCSENVYEYIGQYLWPTVRELNYCDQMNFLGSENLNRLCDTIAEYDPNGYVPLAIAVGGASLALYYNAPRFTLFSQSNQAQIDVIDLEQNDNELYQIANFNENAMRALSDDENLGFRILDTMYSHHLNSLEDYQAIDSQIFNYIKSLYDQNPVENHAELAMTEPNNLSESTKTKLKQNKAHTAFRYFFCQPNFLMHPQAQHTKSFGSGKCADISRDSYQYIAEIWLALNDESFIPPPTFTKEALKELFINLLAELGRAHNFDRTRSRGRRREEYDDGEGDRPSCIGGVDKRLAQFLMLMYSDRPEFRKLSESVVANIFKEQIIAESEQSNTIFNQLNTMSLEALESLQRSLNSLVIDNLGDWEALSEVEKNQLGLFTVSEISTINLCTHFQNYYGERFEKQPSRRLRYGDHTFNYYPQLVAHLLKNIPVRFYDMLNTKLTELIDAKTPWYKKRWFGCCRRGGEG